MKKTILLFIGLLFISCDYFNVKKTSPEAIVEEELKSLRLNDVDVYPTFASCDSVSSIQNRKECFETTLITHITNNLSEEIMVVSKDVSDTIIIDFKLSEKGIISILKMKFKEKTLKELPGIDKKVLSAIDSLPAIYPAIKRGQLVTTQFKLPIIISSN